ncbi:MAG: tetratricopeptide repeat protein [Bacteroidales bacterium]|nr:tetratricopeptide repeat protein [Bacteroidales bacterium]
MTSSRFDKNHLISKREIRIFLSSTFVDLDKERSALIKVFEKIKIEAKKRDVYLTVVDLRWGVTEEESKEGKVISVCLNEIENSHPFFIGLLGNRYGYSPDQEVLLANPELIERYPWIKDDVNAGLSITEIEMQYGALRQSNDTDAAFFIKQSNDKDDNPKLSALKTKITNQKKYKVSIFESIDDLCDKVERTVNEIIDKHFPNDTTSNGKSYHTPYINELTNFFIKNPDTFSAIDSFVNGNEENFLIIAGESGTGKSALLANWIKERKDSSFSIISHFIGDTISENSKQKVLDCIHYELMGLLDEKRLYEATASKEEIEKLLYRAKDKNFKIIIVLDAINQLAENDKNTLLDWFPTIPQGVKVILSTLKHDPLMKVFERNGASIYHLQPLNDSSINEFVVSYLKIYGKKLNEYQINKIIADKKNTNTLVLKTLLNELICFGVHQKLDERIDYYLSADSYVDFFDRVLARLENDYTTDEDLVKTVLSLIYLSKKGLSEEEILSITKFREVNWKLFYCAFYGNLISRKGILSFSHRMIAQAACNRYHLDEVETTHRNRQKIVDYFKDSKDIKRKTTELAYQLYNLDSIPTLYESVLDFDAFKILYHDNSWLLACYWRKLLSENPDYSLENYLRLPYETKKNIPFDRIASFIGTYFPKVALEVKYYNRFLDSGVDLEQLLREKPEEIKNVISNIANCYSRIGDIDSSISIYSSLLKHLHNPSSISETLNAIGINYEYKNDFARALDFYKQAIKVNTNDDHWSLATSYCCIAGAYKSTKKYDEALEYYKRATTIFENYYGDKVAVMTCYYGIAYIYGKLHKKDDALKYIDKYIAVITQEYGGAHYVHFSALQYKASIFLNNEEYDNALTTLLSIVDTFESNSDIKAKKWIKVYSDIGELYNKKKDFKKAIFYYQKAIELATRENDEAVAELADMYIKVSTIYFSVQQYEECADAMEKALIIYEETGKLPHDKMLEYHKMLGILCRKTNEFEKALYHYEKALTYYYKALLAAYASQNKPPMYEDVADDKRVADIYRILRDYPESLERGFEPIVQELGEQHPFTIMVVYKCIAQAYYEQNNLEKAFEMLMKIIKAFENGNVRNDILYGYACSMVGSFYTAYNNTDKAIIYYHKAINLFQDNKIDDTLALTKIYNRLGSEYLKLEQYTKALDYYKKSCDLLEKTNIKPDFDTVLSIGIIYNQLNNTSASTDYYIKALEATNSIDNKTFQSSYRIRILRKLGELYYKQDEVLVAFDYFVKAIEAYLNDRPDDSLELEAVYAAKFTAIIAIYLAKESKKTQKGYDNALKHLEKSHYYICSILGKNNSDTLELNKWIHELNKIISNDSIPWYRKIFKKE